MIFKLWVFVAMLLMNSFLNRLSMASEVFGLLLVSFQSLYRQPRHTCDIVRTADLQPLILENIFHLTYPRQRSLKLPDIEGVTKMTIKAIAPNSNQ